MDTELETLHPIDPPQAEPIPEEPAEPIEPQETGTQDALTEQYAALRDFDPQAPALEALLQGEKGEALLKTAERTGDLLSAYKLTYFDELLEQQAARVRRTFELRAEEKAHLRRTQAHGTDAPLVTREMLEAYRVFDPEITANEVRRYEMRDGQRIGKHR